MKISSQRETNYYFITLTYYRSVAGWDRAKYLKRARKDVRELEKWIRINSKRKSWGYRMLLGISMHASHTNKKKPEGLHIHIVLCGNPGCTIAKKIEIYWRGKGLGKITESKGNSISKREEVMPYD